MQEINYIKHLNGVFKAFQKDNRLNPTHISLYMALFQLWNLNRFRESFHVSRDDVMQLAKVGSKATYHRCLRDLNNFTYLIYEPSHNPFKGSKVKMLKFDTSSKQEIDQIVSNSGQAVVSNNKQIQTLQNSAKLELPENQKVVSIFFHENKWPDIEAQKFYNHYVAIGWKIGGKLKMENWHAAAKNWMIKASEIKAATELSQNQDNPNNAANQNLHTPRNKNYNQPL